MASLLHRRGWSWYAAKTPRWLQWYYPSLVWRVKTTEKKVYLTFDDGPITEVTEFVLQQLSNYNVKGHFFCIGKNVVENNSIYQQIIKEGHSVGNHTQHHLNGWKTDTGSYLQNIDEAAKYIDSNLFRPPYGRITKKQIKLITQANQVTTNNAKLTIIMWDVLSGDFDININGEQCYQNVIKNIQPGSIIVFHDSVKAFPRLQYALPKTLQWLKDNNYTVALLNSN